MLIHARFATLLSRPNLLKYSDYMSECSSRLKEDREFRSDNLLVELGSLHAIGEQIHDSFPPNTNEVHPGTSTRTHMHLQILQNQLRHWKSNLSADLQQDGKRSSGHLVAEY